MIQYEINTTIFKILKINEIIYILYKHICLVQILYNYPYDTQFKGFWYNFSFCSSKWIISVSYVFFIIHTQYSGHSHHLGHELLLFDEDDSYVVCGQISNGIAMIFCFYLCPSYWTMWWLIFCGDICIYFILFLKLTC